MWRSGHRDRSRFDGGLCAEFVSTLNACSEVFEEFQQEGMCFRGVRTFGTTLSKKLLWIRHILCCMYLRYRTYLNKMSTQVHSSTINITTYLDHNP